MKTGYRRESLQLRESKLQRMVHHAVDQETIFLRIDIRNNGATVSTHKMERGGRDNTHRILKRARHMKRHAEVVRRHSFGHGYAYRSHKMGALAIGDQLLETFFRLRLETLPVCPLAGATPPTAKPATAALVVRNFLRLGFFESMGCSSFAAFFHFLPSAPFFWNFRL